MKKSAKNLFLGVLCTLNSLWMLMAVYTWTVIDPQIKTAESDNYVMNLWEIEFWSRNHFWFLLLLIVGSLAIGISNLLKFIMEEG